MEVTQLRAEGGERRYDKCIHLAFSAQQMAALGVSSLDELTTASYVVAAESPLAHAKWMSKGFKGWA